MSKYEKEVREGYREEVPEDLFAEEQVIDKTPEPTYQHTAFGVFKNRDKGLWQVVQLGYNVDGSSGGMKVIYESGFRDEANESLKIAISKSGLLG